MVKNKNVLPGDAVHVWMIENDPEGQPVSSSGAATTTTGTTRTISSLAARAPILLGPPPPTYQELHGIIPTTQRANTNTNTQQIVVTMPAMPILFSGLAGEDVEEWLKSFELIAQAN